MIDLDDQFVRIVLIVFAALAASSLGSFINVCIWRMPRRESVVFAPSHCTCCGAKIKFYDNIPILSYLILRGKCRNCRQKYSPRYFFVELFCGIAGAWLAGAALYGLYPGYMLISGMTLILISTAIFFTDIQFHIIPNQLVFSGVVIGLLARMLLPVIDLTGFAVRLGIVFVIEAWFSVFNFIGKKLAKDDVFAPGDIKFVMAIAALTGLKGLFPILFVASLTATLGGTIYALGKKIPLKNMQLPFGAFLAGCAIIYVFSYPWINIVWSNIFNKH